MNTRTLIQTFLITGLIAAAAQTKAYAQVLPVLQLGPGQADILELTPGVQKSIEWTGDGQTEVRGFKLDLNADGIDDYIIQSDASLCGTGGCPFEIINGRTEQKIGELFGSPVFVFDRKINSFDVLHVYSHSSARSGTYSCFVFDGAAYVPVSSVYLYDQSLDELFGRFKNVPRYPGRQAARFHVNQGEAFSAPLSEDLTLNLRPSGDGWLVQIEPTRYSKEDFPDGPPNLAAVTPPFHGPNATDIQAWHFRNADNSGPNEIGDKNVNAPGTERVMEYCRSAENYKHWQEEYENWRTGSCLDSKEGCFPSADCHKQLTLEILDLQLTHLMPGQAPQIAAMDFTVKENR